MSISRSFGPVAEQMKEALEQYSKEELVDLLTHIVKTYVVEGTNPQKSGGTTRSGEEHLATLSFTQVILHLQMHLDHREWSMFTVSGNNVWVSCAGQRLNLTGGPGPIPPVPARSELEPPPEGAPAEASEPVEETAPQSPEAVPREPEPFSDDVEASERFGMLEFD
jgi:hypothetical protein